MTFGETILRRRTDLHLTQLALAKKSKVAQGYISDLEAGRKGRPSVEIAMKLARTLSIDLSKTLYLLERPRPRRRRPEFTRRNKGGSR